MCDKRRSTRFQSPGHQRQPGRFVPKPTKKDQMSFSRQTASLERRRRETEKESGGRDRESEKPLTVARKSQWRDRLLRVDCAERQR